MKRSDRASVRERLPTISPAAAIATLTRRIVPVVPAAGLRFSLACLAGLAGLASLGLPGGAAFAAEGRLVADGTCRDGRPNGIYELRAAGGVLRVLGAFHAGKRTGTFIFWNASGGRIAAIPYDEDVRNGTIATWHIGTRPAREIGRKLEAPVQRGKVHGTLRSWYRNGKPRILAEYERGTLLEVQAWDEAGRAFPEAAARRVEDEVTRERERELDALERLIAEHRPDCKGSADDKRAARGGADNT
ncbi:MAG: hypothetical protein ABI920_01340 [Casimicrobiaceae bacterium]